MTAITLAGVGKSFGALEVIAALDLEIPAGQFVSLIGPSGCGKSTLLRLIAGLLAPSAGRIDLLGEDPRHARAAKHVAIVPQAPGLLPWRSVEANARLLLEVGTARRPVGAEDPTALLHEVGLGSFLRAYPHELSGGMQQRVALVRALTLGAPLLALDEPFAALDEITRSEMRSLLNRLIEARGVTAVLVTHSIPEAVALSDRVLVSSPRPARLIADVTVDLPRPRPTDIDDDEHFVALCAEVRHALHGAGR